MHVEQPRRSSRDKPALQKGQHVRATFAVDSKATWFHGIVMDVGADSKIEVGFEDGEIERLRADQLTIVNRAEEGVAMEEGRTAADVEQPQEYPGAVSCIPECTRTASLTFEIAQRRLRYELAAAAASLRYLSHSLQ